MTVSTGASVRVARALVTSATAMSLAVGAHLLGGGAAPPGPVLAAVGAFVLLAATALARRQLRWWSLLPAVAAIQYAVHATFVFVGPGTTSVALAARSHVHGASGSALLESTQAAAQQHGAAPSMLALHAAATVLAVGVLVATDHAARLTAHWLRSVLPLIRRPLVRPPAPAAARAPQPQSVGAVASLEGLIYLRPRRGPPVVGASIS